MTLTPEDNELHLHFSALDAKALERFSREHSGSIEKVLQTWRRPKPPITQNPAALFVIQLATTVVVALNLLMLVLLLGRQFDLEQREAAVELAVAASTRGTK